MSSSTFEVPLIPAPQTLSVTLAGVALNITVKWNDQDQVWVMDLYDQGNTLLAGGIYMVTGVDLLSPYPDLGIAGQLQVQTDTNTDALPLFTNLGVTSHLYFIPNPTEVVV